MVDGRLVHEAMARPGRRRTDGAARQLCGSNRRRVAWDDRRQPFRCARALVNKPDVLLMDEPLANLDSLTRFAMQDELLALWQRERFTAFLVTHDVEEALYLAGRVLVLSPRRRAFWPTSRLTYPIRDIAAVWSSRSASPCAGGAWATEKPRPGEEARQNRWSLTDRISSAPHRWLALRQIVIHHSDRGQEEPVTHPLPQPTRTDYFDRAGANTGVPCYPAEPDGYHRANICHYVKVHGETRIKGAKIDGAFVIHQPPQFLAFRGIGKFKPYRGAASREMPRDRRACECSIRGR